jgi:hypothetical protein
MAVKKTSSVYVSWPKPDFEYTVKTHKHFRRNFHGAMLYAHYEMTAAELKKEVTKYLRSKDPKHPLLERIKDINENRFTTIGKYMYLLNHGCDVPDDIFAGMMPALEKTIYEEETRLAAVEKEAEKAQHKEAKGSVEIQPVVKAVISIQERLREKAREVAGEVEGWIDEFMMDKKQAAKTVEEFVNLFKSADLKSQHMRHIQDIFERRADEIAEAALGKDKDLAEAYSNYTKPELKKFDVFHKNLLKACVMMQEVAKVERAPRVKKAVSSDKVVSKLKYKKDDKVLGIVSVNPTSIIGAKEVWVFDTKTRKLTKYVADDIVGPLSVKGASIIGLNQAKSTSKTLRYPATQLAAFKKCGKVQLRTFMEEIPTVGISPTGKINENQIILKIA